MCTRFRSVRAQMFALLVAITAFGASAADQPESTRWSLADNLDATASALATSLVDSSTETDVSILFEPFIRPILENRCVRCHGPNEEKGELRLDTLAAALYGGESGEAVVPGDLDESILIQAIRHLEKPKMPPKNKLPQLEIDLLTRWVKGGAPWPKSAVLEPRGEMRSVPVATFAVSPGPPVSFNQDIRPILSDKCYACHGPDGKTRKAGLRFDQQESALGVLVSGNRAVVPGDLKASQLFNRIAAESPDDQMPPADFHKQLSRDEIELLGRWISQGAPWEQHWAFIPPKRSPLPEVPDPARVRNPIDYFVSARLAKEGLTPNEEADKRTLIRRATLDLTGLPPTLEEVHAFLGDTKPGAYERVVDRLLQSPAYAEHQARYWLDAARYADTNGYHIDNERYMWRWRDWVIDAFNENKPFDEFTVEQLAGDLLPNPTQDQLIATGFNRNHMVNFEGGAIPEEYRLQYVMDRVNTTSTVWMALTVACAQCHDHKYDPITQKEFYSLGAFFNSIDEIGLDGSQTGNAQPFMPVPSPEQAQELEEKKAKLAELEEVLNRAYPKLDAQQTAWEQNWAEVMTRRWNVATPSDARGDNGTELTVQPDGSVLASGPVPVTDQYTVAVPATMDTITGIRLELLTHDSIPNDKVGRGENGNAILTDFTVAVVDADGAPIRSVALKGAAADIEQKDLEAGKAIDGDKETGWSSNGQEVPGGRTAVFLPTEPIQLKSGEALQVQLAQESKYEQRVIGRFRLSLSSDPMLEYAIASPWKLIGPFPAGSNEEALDTKRPPEKKIRLEKTYNHGKLAWESAPDEWMDGAVQPLTGGKGANYLYRTIYAPTARKVTLTLGSSEAIRLWLNGEQVFASEDRKMLRKNEVQKVLSLDAGDNELLLKVVSFGDKSRFFFKLDEAQPGGASFPVRIALAKPAPDRTDAERTSIRETFRTAHMPEWESTREAQAATREQIAALEKEIPSTMVMRERDVPRDTFVLKRGVYDKPGEQVHRVTPAALPPMDDSAPRDRLGLAQWLVSDEQPLTARVTVNRFWQRYFGYGLVKTAEDFGSQGEWPTHPELLDWLAVEFRESGWDVRALHRLIVTSATYRQSSRTTPEKYAVDPDNRLFSRGARFRLDAEEIRDSALAISGLLVPTLGGPSVRPYQPPGLWKEVAYGGNFTAQVFAADTGDALHRRSMYTFWKRTSPPPSMMVFDAPNRETCAVRRSRSNTPLQALTLMNDPQFVEASRVLAERMLREGGAIPATQIAYAFELATGRPIQPREQEILLGVYNQELSVFEQTGKRAEEFLQIGDAAASTTWPPEKLAAMSIVANMVLNLDETITRN
jgi:Protein of unknown function (DUF1553)/Protein of unknown function (DUF1549)/Planctomycete cytochrome C